MRGLLPRLPPCPLFFLIFLFVAAGDAGSEAWLERVRELDGVHAIVYCLGDAQRMSDPDLDTWLAAPADGLPVVRRAAGALIRLSGYATCRRWSSRVPTARYWPLTQATSGSRRCADQYHGSVLPRTSSRCSSRRG